VQFLNVYNLEGGGAVADYVVVDLLNVVFQTFCDPMYARERLVRQLIRRKKITVTEATDALIRKILHTKYNNFSIILVLDCEKLRRTHAENEHMLFSNNGMTVELYVAGDADKFIVDLFVGNTKEKQKEDFPDFNKKDNVFVVTNDRELKSRINMKVLNSPKNTRPKVYVIGVPSPHASNPVVPVIVDIHYVRNNGLTYLHPA